MQPAHYRSREHERTGRQSMSERRFRGPHIFLRRIRHTRTQRTVRTPLIVMSCPLSQKIERRCASDIGIIQSRHSLRIVPITRSQIEFALGLAIGDRNTSTPKARIESSRCLAKIRSRSWIRYLLRPSMSPITSQIGRAHV